MDTPGQRCASLRQSRDKTITRFWVAIPVDSHVADLLPDIGDCCIFFSIKPHKLPGGSLSAGQIENFAREVVRAFHSGNRVSVNLEENLTQYLGG